MAPAIRKEGAKSKLVFDTENSLKPELMKLSAKSDCPIISSYKERLICNITSTRQRQAKSSFCKGWSSFCALRASRMRQYISFVIG